MNKIINSKTVFCNYHEISISDGISHDGLELSIRNMENPKEYVSVPLDKEELLLVFKLINETLEIEKNKLCDKIQQDLQFGDNDVTENVRCKNYQIEYPIDIESQLHNKMLGMDGTYFEVILTGEEKYFTTLAENSIIRLEQDNLSPLRVITTQYLDSLPNMIKVRCTVVLRTNNPSEFIPKECLTYCKIV